MSVWVLLMVLVAPVDGIESTTFLNKFDSPGAYTDCMTERDRISADMEKAYPNDKSYRIECRDQTVKAITRAEYDEIITIFARTRHPKEKLSIKVTNFKPLMSESGSLPIMALQINVFFGDGGHSYILILKEKTILGWIDAGDVEPEEEDAEEEFPGKEFA